DQMYTVEALTQARGQAAGRPPFDVCLFIAASAVDSGFRFVSAWRTEAEFRAVVQDMLGPDLASVGLNATNIEIAPVVSMAIPGARSD
ncbi:MAG: hypothetical protein ACRDQ2_04040, partial [Gaiellales bacterium]